MSDFTFEHNGETFTMPAFKTLPAGLIRRTRNLEPADLLFSIIEGIVSPQTLAALDDMDMGTFGDLQQRWIAEADVSLGESGSSSI